MYGHPKWFRDRSLFLVTHLWCLRKRRLLLITCWCIRIEGYFWSPFSMYFCKYTHYLYFSDRFSKEVYNNFEPILKPFYTQTLFMICNNYFAWQPISNYLTPFTKKRLTQVTPHTVVITSGHPHKVVITSGHPHKVVITYGHPHKVMITSGRPHTEVITTGHPTHGNNYLLSSSQSSHYLWSRLTQQW